VSDEIKSEAKAPDAVVVALKQCGNSLLCVADHFLHLADQHDKEAISHAEKSMSPVEGVATIRGAFSGRLVDHKHEFHRSRGRADAYRAVGKFMLEQV